MAILRMHKQAYGCHAQGREACCFGNTIHFILLDTLACYTRQLIQLYKLSLAESFFMYDYVRSKYAIVHGV